MPPMVTHDSGAANSTPPTVPHLPAPVLLPLIAAARGLLTVRSILLASLAIVLTNGFVVPAVAANVRDEAVSRDEAAVNAEITALNNILRGEPSRGIALTPGPPALAQRISQLLSAVEASTALPTADQDRLTRRSHERLGEVVSRLNTLIETTVPGLFKKMDALRVSWTAGRPLALAPLTPQR